MKKLITEFIGTFFLVFTIGCASASGSLLAAGAIGSVLMVMVYAGGHISGAHYNPAVSFAIYLRRRMNAGLMIQYWIVQLLGGLAGAICSQLLTNNPGSVVHAPGAGVSSTTAILAEIAGTFALAYVVLNVATAKANSGNSYFGLAIGFTVLAMAVSLGPISGGAFNPAVGSGRNLANELLNGGGLQYLWIYWVGPVVGAGVAAILFNYLNPDDL